MPEQVSTVKQSYPRMKNLKYNCYLSDILLVLFICIISQSSNTYTQKNIFKTNLYHSLLILMKTSILFEIHAYVIFNFILEWEVYERRYQYEIFLKQFCGGKGKPRTSRKFDFLKLVLLLNINFFMSRTHINFKSCN